MFILVNICQAPSCAQNADTFQTTIEDLIQITPQDFSKPSAQGIKDAINTKYSNKVIQKIGLCVCMWDLLKASEGLISHGTGLVNVNGRQASSRDEVFPVRRSAH